MTTPPPNEPTVGSLLRTLIRSFGKAHKQCENARFIVADVPLVKHGARRILPLGLCLTHPPQATLFVVNYTAPTFTFPYLEAGLLIHVRTPLGRGFHCCWMVVDDDTPMIYGRETLAYPKKAARITFHEVGSKIRASVERRGVEILRIEATRGTPISDPGPIFGAKTFNVGGIGQMLGFNPIWLFRLNETVREAYAATMQLKVNYSAFDPIGQFIAGKPMRPRFIIEDIAGAKYLLPVGVAGLKWFANTYLMRYR